MNSVRMRAGFGVVLVLATASVFLRELANRANGAPNWGCYANYKCDLYACKDLQFDPNNPGNCFDQNFNKILNCVCTLTDTSKYTMCSYTGGASDYCVADSSNQQSCKGTYTPPGGQPTTCYYWMYICDPNAPKNPNGIPLACAQQ